MKPIPINIAVEDLLSEAVAKRLLLETGRNYAIGAVYNRGGNGYLRKTALGWNAATKSVPFFLLTDLDADVCASALLDKWFPSGIHDNFIVRVAVREVESWLLADEENFSLFLGVSRRLFPNFSDETAEPKSTLVRIASKSNIAGIRRRVVPSLGTSAKQGRDYNTCLTEFVGSAWNPRKAAKTSPSLRSCLQKLDGFEPTWAF